MTNTIRVISIDNETTALNHILGHAWAIGIAWTDYPFNHVIGTVYKQPICHELIEIAIPKQWWNGETFRFCMQHNKTRLNDLMIKAAQHEEEYGVLDSFEAVELYIQDQAAGKLYGIVQNLIRGLGKEDYIVVFNHPDFDVPFLQKIWPGFKDSGFYYRNIKDMQSLIEGHLGRLQAAQYLKAMKEVIGGVKHSASDDAIDQLKTLIGSGAIKK